MKNKVLLVDDEDGIRRILRLFLEKEDFVIREAASANQAFAAVEEEKPDLIILDVILMGTTGFEICEKLKNDPKTEDIIIMLFTALNKESDIAEGRRVGADYYLMKPLNPKDIADKVKVALS